MTTATTVLALLPLALGVGEGADAQAPLARVVVGGLTVSAVITLGLIPVVYSLAHRESSPGPSGGAARPAPVQAPRGAGERAGP
jgi:HAE1 family hydrophobic/amphiphilic exporter-1